MNAESTPVNFCVLPEMGEQVQAKVATARQSIDDVLLRRQQTKADLDGIANIQSGTLLEAKFEAETLQSNYVQTFIDERDVLADTLVWIPDSIEEARRKVKQVEADCETAFGVVAAQVDQIGLPFTNANQRTFYIRNSRAYKLAEAVANGVREYEKSIRKTEINAKQRIEWLTAEIDRLKAKLIGAIA